MQEIVLVSVVDGGLKYSFVLVLYMGRVHGYKVNSEPVDGEGEELGGGETLSYKDFNEGLQAYYEVAPASSGSDGDEPDTD